MSKRFLEIVQVTSYQGVDKIEVVSEPIYHLLVALDMAKLLFARLVICNPNSKLKNDFTLTTPSGKIIQLRLQHKQID
jgi:hypothetical protein